MALENCNETLLGCTRCSYCKWIPFAHVKSWRFAKGCPSVDFKKFHTYSAGGKLSAALSFLENRSTYSDKLQEIAFECQLCGLCDVNCKICRYDMEPLETLHELRFKLVEGGHSLPKHQTIINNLKKEGNSVMKPGNKRGDWAESLNVKDLTRESADVVFHAGCKLSFDKNLQKTARTAISLLIKNGVDVGVMGKNEYCCGGRAYDMGFKEEFVVAAKKNIDLWTKAGVKTIVTSCSHCYHAFKRLYPKIGSDFIVLHTVEVIDNLIKENKIKFTGTVPLKVTYHDPCHLGRQGEPYIPWDGTKKKVFAQITKYEPPKPRYLGAWGIYDPPRNILKAIPGLKLVEMERVKEYSWCCGAGSGVREAYPDFAKWTASERIEEAKATGAEALVTACPWCESNFSDVTGADSQILKVYDIIDLVEQAI